MLEAFSTFDPTTFLLEAGVEKIVWSVFLILLTIFAVYTLLLLYHWLKHGAGSPITWLFMAAYGVVSFALLNALFFSALALS